MEKNSLTAVLGYTAGAVSLTSLVVYLYMLVSDLRGPDPAHSPEEQAWMWFFLVTLITCFNVSFFIVFSAHNH